MPRTKPRQTMQRRRFQKLRLKTRELAQNPPEAKAKVKSPKPTPPAAD